MLNLTLHNGILLTWRYWGDSAMHGSPLAAAMSGQVYTAGRPHTPQRMCDSAVEGSVHAD